MATATIGDLLAGHAPSASGGAERVLGRLARHPAIRLATLIMQAERENAELRNDPGMSTVGGLLAHPSSQSILADYHLLWGRRPTTGLGSLYSELVTPGKYGVTLSNDEMVPALSDVLSIAAGRRIDATVLTPEEALEILEGYDNAADQELEEQSSPDAAASVTVANVRITSKAEEASAPCEALACPPPNGTPYQGGAHVCTRQPTGDGKDSHHMPADSQTRMIREIGPAIQMEPTDHAKTASYKGRAVGASYAPQRALIAQGRVMEAFMMDVIDARRIAVEAGDPTRYDAAIAQATAYAECLDRHGLLE